MANAKEEFNFTVKITANKSNGTEQYKAIRKNVNRTTATDEFTIVSGKDFPFTLKGGETLTITGLSAQDLYTVNENTPDDYTASWGNDKHENATISANTTVTCTNTKNAVSPTGVIMTIAPYALMLVVAGAFAVVFLSRRNRAE